MMLFWAISLLLAAAVPFTNAAAVARAPHETHDHDHSHEEPQMLPGQWFHDASHPVHTLFRRGPGDGYNYSTVGSPTWSTGFPPPTAPDRNALPKAWVDAYNAAVAAGEIPTIPPSTQSAPNTNPNYAQGVNPNSPSVCSATYRCRIPGDVWDGPDGVFASSFDDGPLPLTPQLVGFLRNQSLKTTHFMIGVNIIYYPNQFLEAFNAGHDIAVHTWTHPYMTTLSDLDVVGQLGWTMQLIHNSTGGRVPKYWRPPYGDTDTRVSAIAASVFGLTTVIWNTDTMDWGSNSVDTVVGHLSEFLKRPKSPGLITLEHENSQITVGGFINSFPQIAQNGWQFRSLADVLSGGHSYQNSDNADAPVIPKPVYNSTLTSATPSSTIPVSSLADAATSAPASSSTSSARQDRYPGLMVTLSLMAVSIFAVFS